MKHPHIQKVMVIGSGPIVIGQAAEFDYAGTQACIALKEEGYEVILVNSNPATIMTDVQMADKVYMEPLTLEYVAKIIRTERPDALLPALGGQTGLNLAVQLAQKGILRECRVQLLGTPLKSIEQAEDREQFKSLCKSIKEPTLPSDIANSKEEALMIASEIGYPVVVRPAYTLGGTGGGFAYNADELRVLMGTALQLSPVHQVLIEKSVKGYMEIEFEVMRDSTDKAITICGMENIDPVGVHTGDSMVVAPILTLPEETTKKLEESAHRLIKALKIEGGCNVQFALHPQTHDYYLIEVNPRVSRSSALASKATSYPIARVTAKVALGLTLDEIMLDGMPASHEPEVDYVVTKLARFPFDKFADATHELGTQMKATGEVMSIGANFEESFLKAIRGLEQDCCHIHRTCYDGMRRETLIEKVRIATDDRIFQIGELLRQGESVEQLYELTQITPYFLKAWQRIVDMEGQLKEKKGDVELLRRAKEMGFSDQYIGQLWNKNPLSVYHIRAEHQIFPGYRMINACATAAERQIPYYYATYACAPKRKEESMKRKVLVLGSGPIRIGQGIEFDYSTVHAVKTLQREGYEALIINNNPETVSTDYTTADGLYFESLTVEDVMNLYHHEPIYGCIVSLGGQTAINLSGALSALDVPIIGTDVAAIENAEDRGKFEQIMQDLAIPQPKGCAVTTIEEGVKAAAEIGYPVLVRPSFVLGGRAMQIVGNEERLRYYLQTAVDINSEHPVLVDRYIIGKELEVDAICDGEHVYVPGIMEHIEHTGIHSGDSIAVYPTFSVSERVKWKIVDYTRRLGLRIGIKGLFNIQFICDASEEVYVIEVNPRSSRSVPFLSKATGVAMASIATQVMLGKHLRELGYSASVAAEKNKYYVKAPTFSFAKIQGMETYLSPEMKSTGEAIGYDSTLNKAVYKALQATNMNIVPYGTLLVTIAKGEKARALPVVKRFYDLGFNIEATTGTAQYLREHGIRTHALKKLSEGSTEIRDSLRQGYVSYVINFIDLNQHSARLDGYEIRREAVENNITLFTSLETVNILLDVLEERTLKVATIDA